VAAGEQSALKLNFEHGSSLGGARPKASVVRENGEWIAKFSQPDDPLDIPRLEWACLRMARLAGINVPDHELVNLNGRSALLVCRFDRSAEGAIHYLSLHSLLAMQRVGPADVVAPGGIYSYSGAATLYRRAGVPDPGRRFFERMMFNVLIGNTDDHARNHGLLYRNGLWDMAPAFDLVAYGASRHSLGIGRAGREASIANALDAADCFDLDGAEGERILGRLQAVVSQAPAVLAEAGMRGGISTWRWRGCGIEREVRVAYGQLPEQPKGRNSSSKALASHVHAPSEARRRTRSRPSTTPLPLTVQLIVPTPVSLNSAEMIEQRFVSMSPMYSESTADASRLSWATCSMVVLPGLMSASAAATWALAT